MEFTEHLRETAKTFCNEEQYVADVLNEAANEIERLRQELGQPVVKRPALRLVESKDLETS